MVNILTKFLKFSLLNEKRCLWCLNPFQPSFDFSDSVICPDCLQLFKPISGHHCQSCAIVFPLNAKAKICGACLAKPFLWQHIACYGTYKGALRELILRLKFQGEFHLAEIAGQLLLNACACLPKPDFIVAIPQHKDRLRFRGYNHIHELALVMARLSGLNIGIDLLERTKPSPPQASLSGVERRQMSQIFQVSRDIHNAKIWLLDDVLTTGTTLNVASQCLLEAGAKEVSVAILARTLL